MSYCAVAKAIPVGAIHVGAIHVGAIHVGAIHEFVMFQTSQQKKGVSLSFIN